MTVYFGKSEAFWGCNDLVTSETIPDGFNKNCDFASIKFRSENGAPRRSFSNQQIYDYWYKIVEIYSAKLLMNESDKLVAISGLARALYKSRWVGKLFHKHITRASGWRTWLAASFGAHKLVSTTKFPVKPHIRGLPILDE